MKTNTDSLLNDLIERTKSVMNVVEELKQQPEEKLNQRKNEQSWSALECIEHLNFYGRFYNPEIKKRINESKYQSSTIFKSGILGNYFANSMLPKDGSIKKMNTLKVSNPIGSKLSIEVLNIFLEQQKELLNLLNASRKVNLNKTKTAISLTSLIRLKLGDTFRFIIYHNQRHMLQAQEAIKH